MTDCIIRGACYYIPLRPSRSTFRDRYWPKALGVVSFRLILPPKTYRTLRGGSLHNSFPASAWRSAYLSSKTAGFRLVLPCRASAIHGGDYFSLRPTSSLRTWARTGRLSKFLGFRIATPASIAPPSQQPKIISLISIAVCDDGSISIHIGKQ
jgi:hypothetical protein